MPTSKKERPLADPAYEQHAHEMFPVSMSPEEYVARFGSGWGSCSFPSYSYRDEVLDVWLQKFHQLITTPGMLGKLRDQFLTPEEIEKEQGLDKTRWESKKRD